MFVGDIMSTEITNVSDADWDNEVLQSGIPVLVDYFAKWCGPCKLIAPILEEVAETYKDKVKICKLDIDENPEVTLKYSVRSVPTLMLFQDGQVEATKVGALSKHQLEAFLDMNV